MLLVPCRKILPLITDVRLDVIARSRISTLEPGWMKAAVFTSVMLVASPSPWITVFPETGVLAMIGTLTFKVTAPRSRVTGLMDEPKGFVAQDCTLSRLRASTVPPLGGNALIDAWISDHPSVCPTAAVEMRKQND